MDYTKIDGLLEQDENPELYELQCEIINSTSLSDDEKLLRLAIMQTNPPIDDWENAAEIIRNYVTELHGDALLIAVYIAVTAYETVYYAKVEHFLGLLNEEYERADDRFRSIAAYLRAKYMEASFAEEEQIVAAIEKSISLCPDYAMHYIMLANYKAFDEKSGLLDKALANIKKVRMAEEVWCLPESHFADPETVMATITSTVVPEDWYNELIKRKNYINNKERYNLFRQSLDHCGIFLLDLANADIEYHLFEEFDGDCISFLNKDFLNRIVTSGKISQEIADMTGELSGKFRSLENTDLWNAQAVRESAEWREILELSDRIKVELTGIVSRTPCIDRTDRKIYRIFNADTDKCNGYLTEYADHPTVQKSITVADEYNEEYDVIGPGSLTVIYKNGEKYSFPCYTDTVYAERFGVSISADGERIYVASHRKGLWCFGKRGEVIWKTRYTTAEQLYPHSDGCVTFTTSRNLILLGRDGNVIKKRNLFDGFRCEMTDKTIAILTSECVAAVIDVCTLDPIVKFSLSKLNIYHLFEIAEAGGYYILQGAELSGITELPNGKREINQKAVIYVTDNGGQVIRKIEDARWPWLSRAYLDSKTNEIVLYAENRLDTDKVYRIPIN